MTIAAWMSVGSLPRHAPNCARGSMSSSLSPAVVNSAPSRASRQRSARCRRARVEPDRNFTVTAIAYLQPFTRADLSRLADREISRNVIGALKRHGLIDDLAVCDLSCRTRVLSRDATGRVALLQEASLVDDENHAAVVGQSLKRIVSHNVAQCIRVPPSAIKDGLLASWPRIARSFRPPSRSCALRRQATRREKAPLSAPA